MDGFWRRRGFCGRVVRMKAERTTQSVGQKESPNVSSVQYNDGDHTRLCTWQAVFWWCLKQCEQAHWCLTTCKGRVHLKSSTAEADGNFSLGTRYKQSSARYTTMQRM